MSTPARSTNDLPIASLLGVVALHCATYPCLIFAIWDWCSGLKFEIKYIWSQPSHSALKWQYIAARYFGITTQIVQASVTAYIDALPVSRKFCDWWNSFQMAINLIVMFELELHLVHRIYGLYHCSGRAKPLVISLGILVIIEKAISIILGSAIFRELDLTSTCLIKRGSPKIIHVLIVTGFTQAILWTLAFWGSRRKRVPLLEMVHQDSSWVFGAISVVLIAQTANVYVVSTEILNVSSIYVAMSTFLNCRMIMNLVKFSLAERNNSSSAMAELSTIVEVFESISIKSGIPISEPGVLQAQGQANI